MPQAAPSSARLSGLRLLAPKFHFGAAWYRVGAAPVYVLESGEHNLDLPTLIQYIATIPQCRVNSPQGLPRVDESHVLPADVLEFYTLCGGLSLFAESDYPYTIVSPNEFVRATPIIVGNLWQEREDDISSDWYIVASDPDGQYLTIDLSPQRLGRCYDSFIGRHAAPGYCPIIGTSFTDLLNRLVENRGQYPYWLAPSFSSLGDAYDEVQPDKP
jgi:hypothetical protein